MDLPPHLSRDERVKHGQICPPPIQTALLEHDPIFVVVEVLNSLRVSSEPGANSAPSNA